MIEFVHYMYVTSYGYLEWQDKQLTPNMVTIIMDLKDKLNIMKVEKKTDWKDCRLNGRGQKGQLEKWKLKKWNLLAQEARTLCF